MEFIELLKEKNIPFEIKGDTLIVFDNVNLSNTQIREFPDYPIVFFGDVDLSHTQLKKLTCPMTVCGSLILRDAKIKELPDRIVCDYLVIDGTSITKIPKNLEASCILYTSVKGELDIYIEKSRKIKIGRYKMSIEEWEKFFKESEPFNNNPDLTPEDYDIVEEDFKTAVKLYESWTL